MSRIRVQLDLDPLEVEALDNLRDRFALRSRADAVRFALGIMEWVAREQDRGNQVLAFGNGTISPLRVPGLTDVSFTNTDAPKAR